MMLFFFYSITCFLGKYSNFENKEKSENKSSNLSKKKSGSSDLENSIILDDTEISFDGEDGDMDDSMTNSTSASGSENTEFTSDGRMSTKSPMHHKRSPHKASTINEDTCGSEGSGKTPIANLDRCTTFAEEKSPSFDWSPKVKRVVVPGEPRKICIIKVIPIPVTKDGRPWHGSKNKSCEETRDESIDDIRSGSNKRKKKHVDLTESSEEKDLEGEMTDEKDLEGEMINEKDLDDKMIDDLGSLKKKSRLSI